MFDLEDRALPAARYHTNHGAGAYQHGRYVVQGCHVRMLNEDATLAHFHNVPRSRKTAWNRVVGAEQT